MPDLLCRLAAAVYDVHAAVIVAVIAVRMMKMIADQVIDVAAMRNLLVSALRIMLVLSGVALAGVLRSAALRVAAVHVHGSAVEVLAMRDVHVALMQIAGLLATANRGVAAILPVNVAMLLVPIVAFHKSLHH